MRSRERKLRGNFLLRILLRLSGVRTIVLLIKIDFSFVMGLRTDLVFKYRFQSYVLVY